MMLGNEFRQQVERLFFFPPLSFFLKENKKAVHVQQWSNLRQLAPSSGCHAETHQFPEKCNVLYMLHGSVGVDSGNLVAN